MKNRGRRPTLEELWDPRSVPQRKLVFPYAEMELAAEQLATQLPAYSAVLADGVGRRPWRFTKKQTEAARRKIGRTLSDLRGFGLVRRVLDGSVGPAAARYATIEAETRSVLMISSKKVASEGDACSVLAKRLHRIAAPRIPSGVLGFDDAWYALRKLVEHFVASKQAVDVFNAYVGWCQGEEVRELSQYYSRHETTHASHRRTKPAVLTQKLIVQLRNEYTTSATAFEIILKLLVGLARVARGDTARWDKLAGTTLGPLLAACRAEAQHCPPLGVLALSIELDMRNALTHAIPTSAAPDRIRFRTKKGSFERKAGDWFDDTKRLTAAVAACSYFEPLWNYLRFAVMLSETAHAIDRETSLA